MFTMPYVNFAALSKEKDKVVEPDIQTGYLPKKDEEVDVRLTDGTHLTGKFLGFWGEEDDSGIFVDDGQNVLSISDKEYKTIEKASNLQIDEVLKNAGIEQMNESVSSEFLGLIGLPVFAFLATIGIGVLCNNRYETVQQLKDSCEVVGVSKLDDKLIVKCKSNLPSNNTLSYTAGEKHLAGSTNIPMRIGNITTFRHRQNYDKEYYVVVHYNNKNKEPTYVEFIPDGSWSKEKHKETIKLDDGKLKDKIESLLKEME